MEVEASVDINRPIDEVFAYLTNFTNSSQWMSMVAECALEGSGPIGVGSRIRSVGKFLGRRLETTAEVTRYEPPTRVAMRMVSGPLHVDGEERLESIGEGTRYHTKKKGETGGVFKLADPVVEALTKRTLEADLHTLKALLEAKVPAEA